MKLLLICLLPLSLIVGLGSGQTTEPWCPPETTTPKPVLTTEPWCPPETTTAEPFETTTSEPPKTTEPWCPPETTTSEPPKTTEPWCPPETTTSEPFETTTSEPPKTTEPWCPPETTTTEPFETTTSEPPTTTTTEPPTTTTTKLPQTTTPSTPCDAGWERYYRVTGPWCIRVFKGTMIQADAEAKCKAQGATLSGLQNGAEIRGVTTASVALLGTSSVWLGARRTTACANSYLTATCTIKTSFEWTDGSATGVLAFLWNNKQPENLNKKQRCAVLLGVVGAGSVVDSQGTWYNNRMDDVECDNYGPSNGRKVKGYACGKKARS